MFSLKNIPATEKIDLAFQMVVAMRDTINIAKKKGHKSTYENSIRLFHDFSPELYADITTSLHQRNISDDAKVYIAKAEILSQGGKRKVTPLELLQREIDELQEVMTVDSSLEPEKRKVLKNKLGSLEGIKKSLKPRALTENRILIRDTKHANRDDFGAKFVKDNDFFVDYELGDSKYLRIRMLHPDQPEHITGADLVYEQHDEESGKIRVLFLQYKIWDDGVLYFSQTKNLDAQLQKLEKCLCDNNWCSPPGNLIEVQEYRFPYCSAFLRPTDKLQHQNEKLVSSGIHVPICTVQRMRAEGVNKLEKKYLRLQNLNHEIFEHLFNRGFIGSKWMDQDDVEKLYRKNKILESDDTVTFYAREIRESIY
jgi:hypothetical protein